MRAIRRTCVGVCWRQGLAYVQGRKLFCVCLFANVIHFFVSLCGNLFSFECDYVCSCVLVLARMLSCELLLLFSNDPRDWIGTFNEMAQEHLRNTLMNRLLNPPF